MKSYFKGVATQGSAILLAALGAGLIAFFQSAANSTGICEVPPVSPSEAGGLGALFKATHTVLSVKRGIMPI